MEKPAGDWSGYSVSLSADGSTVAIGAPASDAYADGYVGPSNIDLETGEVYIYQRSSNGNWEQVGDDIQGRSGMIGWIQCLALR